MKDEQFEHILRKKLSTFDKEPSSGVWTKIEAQLNEGRNRRPFVWQRYAAVAAMLLLLLGSTFFFVNRDDNAFTPDSVVLSEQMPHTLPSVQPIVSSEPSQVAPKKTKQSPICSVEPKNVSIEPQSPLAEIPQTVAVEGDEPSNDKTPTPELTVENAEPIDLDKRHEAMSKFLADGEQSRLAEQRSNEQNSSPLALGIVAKGTPASASSGLTNGSQTFSNRAIANLPNAYSSNEIPTKAFHLMPISAGITVQKELGKGFALETGVIYTYLYSTFEKELPPVTKRDQQSLHYLGIPLSLRYQFFSFDKFYLFAKLGAILEGNIYGEIKESVIYPLTQFSTTERVQDEKLQLSVLLAPGIAYQITRNIHLSLEPSVQYYIPNGSNLQTIRTDQPVAFNFRLGISYNF